MLAERLQIERLGPLALFQAITDPRVLVLAVVWLMSLVAAYGVTFFLPQIVKDLGVSIAVAGVLTAIPYAIGTAGPLLWGYSSDRRRERRWHFIVALPPRPITATDIANSASIGAVQPPSAQQP